MGLTLSALGAAVAIGITSVAPASVATGPIGSSCWVSGTTGASVCVDAGEDLLLAVAERAGVLLVVPDSVQIGGIPAGTSQRTMGDDAVTAQFTEVVVSILYDHINYGGGSFVMSYANANCAATAYGFTSLVPYGWNDRASSFRSYAGCTTAVFSNEHYGGTRYGYQVNASSLGGMNDAASSWRVD